MNHTKRNRQILTYPNPYLRQATPRVERFDAELEALFEEMCVLMHASDGVGLAATQVGESVRLLVLSSYVFLSEAERQEVMEHDGDMGPDIAVVNPEVIEQSAELILDYEGCLSFPEVYIKVKRPAWVKIRAQRLDGSEFELEGEGLGARAILHEMDHLTGKVMTDNVSFLDRQKALRDHQKRQKQRSRSAEEEGAGEVSAARPQRTSKPKRAKRPKKRRR